ncbi:MAG: hypothetical protein K1X92_16680 [Bacteroidia bacterium]|nr:hypothetical protein [Bacteroidia bacterium]
MTGGTFKIYIWAGFLLLIAGCNFETQTQKESYKSVVNSKQDLAFNRYKDYLLSTCSSKPIEGCEFEYSPDNTRFFLISAPGEDTCFVAESSIQCGCPGGSCGNDIQVVKKEKKVFRVLLTLCGYTVEPEDTITTTYRSFSYNLRGYNSKQLKVRVRYSPQGFRYDTLEKGGISFSMLKSLLKDNPECLPDLDCPLADRIVLDSLKTDEKGGFLWKVQLKPEDGTEKIYLLSQEGDYRILNKFESVYSVDTLPEISNGYFNLRTETLFKIQTWAWNGKKYILKEEMPVKD